jgi:MoxR-like ATPase
MIRLAREVPVASHVHEYAVSLVLATHPEREDAPPPVKKYVRYGASPRGLQSLVIAGQVRALLEGRYNLSADDLQAVAYPAMRHRLILNFEAQAEGLTADRSSRPSSKRPGQKRRNDNPVQMGRVGSRTYNGRNDDTLHP